MQYSRGINGLFIAIVLLERERYPRLVVIARGHEWAAISVHCHKSVLDLKHRVFLHVVANFIVHVLRDVYKTHTRRRMVADQSSIFTLKS